MGDSSPQIIFRILPGPQLPTTSTDISTAVIYGLSILVEQCIAKRGDSSIAKGGMGFARGPADISIIVKSSLPGRSLDITYKWMASILRGIWELTTVHGYFTVAMEVYVDQLDPVHLRGYASVHPGLMASNLSSESDMEFFTSNVNVDG